MVSQQNNLETEGPFDSLYLGIVLMSLYEHDFYSICLCDNNKTREKVILNTSICERCNKKIILDKKEIDRIQEGKYKFDKNLREKQYAEIPGISNLYDTPENIPESQTLNQDDTTENVTEEVFNRYKRNFT